MTRWPYSGWAGWAIWACSSRRRWVSAPWPWRADRTRDLAFELGPHHYIDSTATSVAEELQKLGGARVVPATAASADAISAAVDGLATHGALITPAVIADSLHV